jgi:hypothetical protein
VVAVDAIDGRKGIDSLAQLCREKLQEDSGFAAIAASGVFSTACTT